jgi:hypothetical protein
LALGVVAACAAGPGDGGEPDVHRLPLDSLVLAPGQEVRVDLLRMSFQRAGEDSRCPIDVVCVWQGNAAVELALGIGTGPSYPFVLNTANGAPAVEHGGYRVTLLDLAPAPRAGVEIPPDEYRATVRVEAVD